MNMEPTDPMTQEELEATIPHLLVRVKHAFAQMPEFVQALVQTWEKQGIIAPTWVGFQKGNYLYAILSDNGVKSGYLYSKVRKETLIVRRMSFMPGMKIEWDKLFHEYPNISDEEIILVSNEQKYDTEYRIEFHLKDDRRKLWELTNTHTALGGVNDILANWGI